MVLSLCTAAPKSEWAGGGSFLPTKKGSCRGRFEMGGSCGDAGTVRIDSIAQRCSSSTNRHNFTELFFPALLLWSWLATRNTRLAWLVQKPCRGPRVVPGCS